MNFKNERNHQKQWKIVNIRTITNTKKYIN